MGGDCASNLATTAAAAALQPGEKAAGGGGAQESTAVGGAASEGMIPAQRVDATAAADLHQRMDVSLRRRPIVAIPTRTRKSALRLNGAPTGAMRIVGDVLFVLADVVLLEKSNI
jgi:hypothetical protein